MHNTINRFWLAAMGVCALAGSQAVKADDEKQNDSKPAAIVLTRKAKDAVQYKSNLALSVSGTDVTLEQNRKHTVKEIRDTGELVILVSDLGGKVTFNGQDMDTPPAPPVTVMQTSSGKIISYKPEMDNNPYLSATTQHLIAIAEQIIYPDKPVKPGDSWKTEIDNPQVKGKKVTITTTYVGSDKADGMPAWKVKQTLDADTDSGGKMTAEITALLDTTNGQLIQADQSAKGIPGTMGAFDWKGKIQRVKLDPDKAEKAAAP